MVRGVFLYTLPLICFILLSSCASDQLSISKMGACSIGDRYEHYSEDGSVGAFDVNFVGEYIIDDMPDKSNISVIFYENILEKSSGNIGISSSTRCYITLCFENNKLLYWGYPEDFLKSDDERLRIIGGKITKIFFEEIY